MISENIVLYQLGKTWPGAVFRNPKTISFKGVTMYSPGVEALGPEILYILPSAGSLSREKNWAQYCFLAAGQSADRLPEGLSCILVPGGDPISFFQELMTFFSAFHQWKTDLLMASEKPESVQRLLDISVDWVPYGTIIWDPTFSLVAFSKNVSSDNPLFQEITANGFLPSDLVKQFFRLDMLSNPNKFLSTIVHRPPNISGEYEICRSFRVSMTTAATLCMFVGHQEPHPGLVEIVSTLCDAIQKFYNLVGYNSNGTYRSMDYLLCKLIEDTTATIDTMRAWLESLSLPVDSTYSVYKVVLNNPTSTKRTLALSQLRRNMPYSEVFIYNDAICAINRRERRFLDQESHDSYIKSVRDFLQMHDAYCGVSPRFNSLSKIALAYFRASAALDIGRAMAPEDRILHYDRFYTYHLLALASKDAELIDLCAPALQQIMESDQGTHMDNISLLRIYLSCDRNITQTAKAMHLHRNSVIYRVTRIQEIIAPMDLENPDDRLHLLNSFKILDYLEAQQKK